PIPGRREVTVIAAIAPPRTTKAGTQSIDPLTGDRVRLTREVPPRRVLEGNLYDGMAGEMSKLPDHTLVDVVTLLDRTSGRVLARFERMDDTWRVIR
ncbi:MAG: hypothetical protein ABL886_13565, partial [Rhodoglobus sp.]